MGKHSVPRQSRKDETPEERRARLAAKSRLWRATHPGYEREHRTPEKRAAWRAQYVRDGRAKAAQARYYETPKGKENRQRVFLRQRTIHRVKYLARKAVDYALGRGYIAKPDRCERCKATSTIIHGHHPDYSKPIEVEWLCPKCHSQIHREWRTAA